MTDPDLEAAPASGHNSVNVAGIDGKSLKEIVERWETIQDGIDDAREDQKELMKEAKLRNLNMKALRRVLKIRRKAIAEYKAELEETENHLIALGMI